MYFLSPSTLLFQSTPSTRRETQVLACNWEIQFISIHSLHTEGDAYLNSLTENDPKISIHSLHTEGDRRHLITKLETFHFNPLPPHGGRHWAGVTEDDFNDISIHSLHTEGDN